MQVLEIRGGGDSGPQGCVGRDGDLEAVASAVTVWRKAPSEWCRSLSSGPSPCTWDPPRMGFSWDWAAEINSLQRPPAGGTKEQWGSEALSRDTQRQEQRSGLREGLLQRMGSPFPTQP